MATELTRQLQRQAQLLVDQVNATAAQPDLSAEDIHAIRVAVKRLRAAWQLLRPFVGKETAQAADRELKLAARGLAASRDRTVMAETLTKLRAKANGADQAAIDAVLALLDQDFPREPGGHGAPSASARQQVVTSFAREARRWRELPAISDAELLAQGLTRTYRRARDLANQAYTENDAEAYHSWRKWAKYLLYQLEWLHARGGKAEKNLARLRKLGNRLGKRNDLALLIGWLTQRARDTGPDSDLLRVLNRIYERDRTLFDRCYTLYEKLFSAKPKHWQATVAPWFAD